MHFALQSASPVKNCLQSSLVANCSQMMSHAATNGTLPPISSPRLPDEQDHTLPTVQFGSPEVLSHVRLLTDVGSMTRLLHECIAYQRSLDDELDSLLSQRTDLDRHFLHLQRSAEVLDIVRSDSDQVLYNVSSTCDLANQVSAKVRELDLAQSRVNGTLQRIDAIVERSNCLDIVRSSIDTEDHESAAKHIKSFLEIDEKYPDSSTEQREQLLGFKTQLEGIVRRKMASAVDERDHPSILRIVKLYPPLGIEVDGLNAFVTYLKKVISMRSRIEYEHLAEAMESSNNSETIDFVACLTNLFKDIVLAIEVNDGILRELCGEDGIMYAILQLQEECDSRASMILKKYMEHRKLSKVSMEINAQSKSSLLSSDPMETIEPREVETYLEEILSLMQIAEDFTDFMVAKIAACGAGDQELGAKTAHLFKSGSFNKVIQDITGFYVILEGFFMVENVRKAIRIDENVPDSLTTSMVDDVFYVLQSCLRRAISTSNISSVIALIGGASSLLANEYTDALQRKTREANVGVRLFVGGTGVHKTGTEIAVALNNADVSIEYVAKLRQEIEDQCAEVFPAPVDREKVKSCLSELGESGGVFKQVLSVGMEQLVSAVSPRIRPLLDNVATVSYELNESEYAENEVNDPWVKRLLHGVEVNVSWLQPMMSGNNYDTLVQMVVEFIVKRLEVIMMQKRFSQLGGLQLDRDVRALVSHVSGMSQRTVRDKFTRLSQMATILNLEKVSEILDFWGENAGPVTWRLTPAEVRRVLGLRVDFRQEAIAALKL